MIYFRRNTLNITKYLLIFGIILVAIGTVIFIIVQFFEAGKCIRLIPAFTAFVGGLLVTVSYFLLLATNTSFLNNIKEFLTDQRSYSATYFIC